MARGKVKPIPEGFHSLTPYLMVRDADRAIEFYRRAFGAEEVYRLTGQDGKTVLHAELRIGDSPIFLGEEALGHACDPKALGCTSVAVHLYVEDVDSVFKRAIAAGARVKTNLLDAFWGDRYGIVIDPFGHEWSLATHTKDLSPEEIRRGAEEYFAEAH
jgi:uncharacterized glyoxalase superfamily protein PhnB